MPRGAYHSVLSARLRNPGNAHVDFRDFIPGRVIRHSCRGQVEDALEGAHRVGGGRTVDAVRRYGGNGGIVAGNAVQLVLELPHLVTGGADAQVVAGPGGGHAGNQLSGIDVHVIAVVVADDLNGGVTLVSQVLGTPLAQTVARDPVPVAVRGKYGLAHAGAGQVVGKDGVHQVIDVFKDVPAVYPLLVIGRGGGNGKVVALVAVPLGVHPVQGEGLYCQDVCVDGAFRPGGIDFAGSYVLDVVPVAHPVIRRGGIARHAVVDDDVFWDDDAAQYDFARLVHGFDFVLRYLGRIIPEQRVDGDDHHPLLVLPRRQGLQAYGLEGEFVGKDFGACHQDGFITFRGGSDVVLGVRLLQGVRVEGKGKRRGRQVDDRRLSRTVRGKRHDGGIRVAGIGDGDGGVFHGNQADGRYDADFQGSHVAGIDGLGFLGRPQIGV